jgi:hypothetical protein
MVRKPKQTLGGRELLRRSLATVGVVTAALGTSPRKTTMSGRLWWREMVLVGSVDAQGSGEVSCEMNWAGRHWLW